MIRIWFIWFRGESGMAASVFRLNDSTNLHWKFTFFLICSDCDSSIVIFLAVRLLKFHSAIFLLSDSFYASEFMDKEKSPPPAVDFSIFFAFICVFIGQFLFYSEATIFLSSHYFWFVCAQYITDIIICEKHIFMYIIHFVLFRRFLPFIRTRTFLSICMCVCVWTTPTSNVNALV